MQQDNPTKDACWSTIAVVHDQLMSKLLARLTLQGVPQLPGRSVSLLSPTKAAYFDLSRLDTLDANPRLASLGAISPHRASPLSSNPPQQQQQQHRLEDLSGLNLCS